MPDLAHEAIARANGHKIICGIDEAGRGPLAGPVCAAAVILPEKFSLDGLNDSKKLSHAKRESLYQSLISTPGLMWSAAIADADEIDRLNILAATHAMMAKAAQNIEQMHFLAIDLCLIDGLRVPRFPIPHTAIVKGDSLSLSIAAASIIAKVTRDRLMMTYAVEFPNYGFEKHMGYGTKQHITALNTYGPCRIHRRSFQPVSQLTMSFD